jgi:hypothetical protein
MLEAKCWRLALALFGKAKDEYAFAGSSESQQFFDCYWSVLPIDGSAIPPLLDLFLRSKSSLLQRLVTFLWRVLIDMVCVLWSVMSAWHVYE